MKKLLKSFILSIKDAKGASAVEYAVLLTLIAAAIILTVGFLGVNTREAFNTLNSELSDLAPSEEDENKCGDKDSEDDADCGIGNDK